MNYVIISCAALLFVSALMIVYRTAKGPTALDRMVSVDMLTSIAIGAFALLAAATRRADLLPVFVVLSIIGFIGSTTLARFSAPLSNVTRKALAQAAAEREAARADRIAQTTQHTADGKLDENLLPASDAAQLAVQATAQAAAQVAAPQADDFLATALMSFHESDVRANQKHVDGNEDRGERS